MEKNNRVIIIEPFFDKIVNALKKILSTIVKGILSPVLSVLRKLTKIVVSFISNKILKPIFKPIGILINNLLWPLKPFFAFIGKILDFIVSIIKFIVNIFDMILSLPFRILGTLGLINFPDPPDPKLKGLGSLHGITKLGNSIGIINSSFTESASQVNKVINRPNFIIFLSIFILSIIFISFYYFYDKFYNVVDLTINYIKDVLFPIPKE